MFDNENMDKILEHATEFVEVYRKPLFEHYKFIEEYCAKKSIILGGKFVEDMVTGATILNPLYELYISENIKETASDMANGLMNISYKGEFSGDNKGMTPLMVYKKNMDGTFAILIGTDIIAKLIYNPKIYNTGLTQNIAGLHSAEKLIVFDNHLLLGLYLYRSFSPQYEMNVELPDKIVKPIFKSVTGEKGYDYYTKVRHNYDKILINDVFSMLSDQWALCGEKALFALADRSIFDNGRLQIVYEGQIRQIHDLLKTHIDNEVYFVNQTIYFPEMPLLKKYTFYFDKNHLVDVFNLPLFVSVPTEKLDNFKICTPPVLAYLRIVDLWSLALAGFKDVSYGLLENLAYAIDNIDETSYPLSHKKYLGQCVNIMTLISKCREEFYFPYFNSK